MKENSFLFRSEIYKRSVPQFTSEEALHPYYLQYLGKEEEENVFKFWRGQILKVMENVFCSFVVPYGELQQFFLIHSRIPLALPKVIAEMKKEGALDFSQNLEEWKQKEKDQPIERPGLAKRVFGYLSSWFSSAENKEQNAHLGAQTKIINLGLLEKLSQKIITKLELRDSLQAQGLVTETELKRLALETMETNYSGEERELILNHLIRSQFLTQGVITIENEELKIFKIQKENSQAISELDRTHLMIEINIGKLSQKIKGLEEKYGEMTAQAKKAVHQKRMDLAKLVLSGRKKLEKHQEHLQILVFELEKQKLAISASESNATIYKTLKQAEQAMKQTTVQDYNHYSKAEQIQEVVHNLEEQKAEQDQIGEIVREQADSEFRDADILKELEEEFEKENKGEIKNIELPSAPKEKIEPKIKGKAVLIS